MIGTRRSEIGDENRRMVQRQQQFRIAADVVTDSWTRFAEVRAVAVIGSVAKTLWKEVPRFREFRRERIEIWHECGDLDLALWLDSQDRLGALRRAAVIALRDAVEKRQVTGVADHHLDVFLIEPESDRYVGRLCKFSECPKGHRDCLVPGCGVIPFNKRVDGFSPYGDLIDKARDAVLYQRGAGRIRSALDLPGPDDGHSRKPEQLA